MEKKAAWLLLETIRTRCLSPPPLANRPGLLGTLMQSGRCYGKFPYHWRSVQQLLPSPWSEWRLLLDHSSNAAQCDLSHSQDSGQVPARASPLTALHPHMHWLWKEGRKKETVWKKQKHWGNYYFAFNNREMFQRPVFKQKKNRWSGFETWIGK